MENFLGRSTEVSADGMFFMLDQSKAGGSCSGDSGGPALIELHAEWYLVGIASFVFNLKNEKENCSAQSVYTNVYAYREWLSKAFMDLSNEPNPFR